MKITQKQSLENPLRFSQLMYRSIFFLLFYIFFIVVLVFINSRLQQNIYLSGLKITLIYLYNILITLAFWFLYLVFITKDNSLIKIGNVIKLRSRSDFTKEITIRWYTGLILFIISIYFFDITSNINAMGKKIIYQGSIVHQNVEFLKNTDKRFNKIKLNFEGKQMIFHGEVKNEKEILGKKLNIKIYEGLFYDYALIQK